MEAIDVICEYRLTYMKLVVEHLHRDLLFPMTTEDSLFMSPEVWREASLRSLRQRFIFIHRE